MVRKIFKKRKDNQNKIKPSGRKRKIFATIALSLSLLFGKTRSSSSQSSSPNFGNQEVHQKLITNREFNLLEQNDQQVILVKSGDSGAPSNVLSNIGRQGQGPSNFPTQPSGGRPRQPSRPVSGVNPYRTAPKFVDQGLGAGGGGGGHNELDDIRPIPDKQKLDQNNPEHPSFYSKKKQSAEQCSIYEQNKGGIDELPDSSEFIYNLEGKSAKQELRKVWKNTEAQKEVLAGLEKMNKGELVPRNQKALQGFKNLKEVKLNKTRIIVNPGKDGAPDQIVGIVMRKHLENFTTKLAKKFK